MHSQMGQPMLPGMPDWTWHGYGMRVGYRRCVDALERGKDQFDQLHDEGGAAFTTSEEILDRYRGETGARTSVSSHIQQLSLAWSAGRNDNALTPDRKSDVICWRLN